MDVFTKTTQNPNSLDGNLLAHVWPKYSEFVDYLNPNASDFWGQELQALYD